MITAIALSASLDLCQPIAELAGVAQSAHQTGVPLAKVLTLSDSPTLQALIISAYRLPRYQTETHQQRAITEFENAVLLQCLEGADK